jgi:hypothetical protein
MDGRGTCRPFHLLVAGFGLRIQEVGADGVMEQVRLLGHEADDPAQRHQAELPDVQAIDLHRARLHVVQPRDEVRRGRLAGARRAHQGDQLPRRRLEIDVAQAERQRLGRGGRRTVPAIAPGRRSDELVTITRDHLPRRGRWVGEGHVAEADAAGDRRGGKVDGVRRIHDHGIQLQVLEDPVEQRQGALDLHLHVQQLAEREEQP